MLKFILVASMVILFLIFSIPVLIAEKYIGKTDPEKKGRQSLAIVRFMFRQILKVAGVHITVKGLENIPADQSVLYVGNHRSYFDILVGYTTVPTPLGFGEDPAAVQLDAQCQLPVFGQGEYQGRPEGNPGRRLQGEKRGIHLDLPGGDPQPERRHP